MFLHLFMIYELRFVAPQRLDDLLSSLLTRAGSMGVVVEDIGHTAVFSSSDFFERCRYKGYFDHTVNRQAVALAVEVFLMHHGEQGAEALTWHPLAEQDWRESWKRHFKPLPLGRRLLVLPSWLSPPEGEQDRVILRIDPEMAFGSGTHETTRGCLEAIERLADAGPLGHVMDVGTGSGILLVCAMLLGAETGLGLDRDPIAVATCARNGRINLAALPDYERRVTVRHDEQLARGPFHTVVANILAPILMAFLTQADPSFHDCVMPGGHLVLSGVLLDQADEVAQCARQQGFVLVECNALGMWAVLVLQKPM